MKHILDKWASKCVEYNSVSVWPLQKGDLVCPLPSEQGRQTAVLEGHSIACFPTILAPYALQIDWTHWTGKQGGLCHSRTGVWHPCLRGKSDCRSIQSRYEWSLLSWDEGPYSFYYYYFNYLCFPVETCTTVQYQLNEHEPGCDVDVSLLPDTEAPIISWDSLYQNLMVASTEPTRSILVNYISPGSSVALGIIYTIHKMREDFMKVTLTYSMCQTKARCFQTSRVWEVTFSTDVLSGTCLSCWCEVKKATQQISVTEGETWESGHSTLKL